MRKLRLFALGIFLGAAPAAMLAQNQGAKGDLKEAGQSVKTAAKSTRCATRRSRDTRTRRAAPPTR